MTESRKLAAILVADIVGYSRLAGVDEDRILARLRTLRSDLIDPTVAVHHGRFVKRTGDGAIIEFRSVVDAVRCAIEVQNGMAERNVGLPGDRRIDFRVGIHVGDVVEEADGDLMGDGVNISARLEGVAKPGGIAMSEDVYRYVKGRLDLKVTDLGPTQLKNIAEPVHVYSLEIGRPPEAKLAPSAVAPERSAPPRLSIVVLPFANIGGDSEQDYFVDGVTESLTTDLSRISGSFIIARNTAFTYKGKAVDVKQVGRELNVRYVLEGSVQRSGSRMRVNVQLVDAESGSHLWAERFDKPVTDLFDMQDEVVARIANALQTRLAIVEAERAERAVDPDALDLLFQGIASVNRGPTLENLTRARDFFERALTLDPTNIEASVRLAFCDALSAVTVSFDPSDRKTLFVNAEKTLTKALAAAPENPLAHMFMGMVLTWTDRAAKGMDEFERALFLNPNLASASGSMILAKIFLGRPEEAEAHFNEATRLSPRDTGLAFWLSSIGYAKLRMGEDEQAVAWLERSIQVNRNFQRSHFWLAAAFAYLERFDEASAAVQAGLAVDPEFTISRFRAAASSTNPRYLAQSERVYEGMRKAGVPVG
jgi:TolB-like protein/class 3 adenylate cyclase/Flp pilus assembly protein TadD